MGLIDQIKAYFFPPSDDARLKDAITLARIGEFESAIRIYDALIESTIGDIRASALLNRALAYSSLDDEIQTQNDLAAVLATSDASAFIKTAAREKLARLQTRQRRTQPQRA